jgi:hypothetical protein
VSAPYYKDTETGRELIPFPNAAPADAPRVR